MKDIIFNLKKEYFEDIKKGIKREEYRETKDFWKKRLLNKEYRYVIIKLGYPSKEETNTDKVLIFKWEGFELKKITHKQFNNKEIEVFAIKLNTRINSL
ncbi:TPA: hypothetical protein NV714_000042 [Escherichia coli]|nr:hypothetical protein [Escherichia coli]